MSDARGTLREFFHATARRALEAKQAPALANATWLSDVSRPPYDQWKRDGVIRAQLYVDDAGTKRVDMLEALSEMGFVKQRTAADGATVFRRSAAKAGGLPVEIVLASSSGSPALFEKIGDRRTDLIIYTGHAGYGRIVNDAIQDGENDGAGQLLVLLQCSGIYSAPTIANAYPQLQLVSTTNVTNDLIDMPMLGAILSGFERNATWRQIHEDVQRALESDPKSTLSHHYFYPGGVESASNGNTDLDKDGVSDVADHLYTVTSEVETNRDLAALAGLGRSDAAAASHAPGAALAAAITGVGLVLQNASMFDAATEKALAWDATLVGDGVFDASADDPNAFRFHIDVAGRLHVAISHRFANVSPALASGMLAFELAMFMAQRGNLSAVDTATFAMAVIGRLRHQTGIVSSDSDLLYARYGLGASAELAAEAADGPGNLTPERFRRVREALAGKTLAAPTALRGVISALRGSHQTPHQAFGWEEVSLGGRVSHAKGPRVVRGKVVGGRG